MSERTMTPEARDATIAATRAEVAALRGDVRASRNEVSEVKGKVAAIDASVVHVARDVRNLEERIIGKLDAILTSKSDHTARIERVETDLKEVSAAVKVKGAWRDRAGWIVSGWFAALAAGYAVMKAFGKLP